MGAHYRSKSTMETTKHLHQAHEAFELLTYRLTTCLGLVHSLCINLLGPIIADSDQSQISLSLSFQKKTPEQKMEGMTREDLEKNGMIDTWLKKHRLLYTGAIRHPFILSIRDGTIDLSFFRTWLGQDYLFVREFAAFVAGVLVKAWKQSDDSYGDTEVILGGLAALNDEVEWFKREASKWDVPLSTIAPQKANGDYCRFLEYLISPEVGYTEAITAFWAIEAVYQESFAHCLEDGGKTPPELQETCQRWGNDGFGQYCLSLKKIANRRLQKASEDAQLFNTSKEVLNKAEVALIRVLEHEVGFWNMSRGGS